MLQMLQVNILMQCNNLLNVSRGASSEKKLGLVMDWMIKKNASVFRKDKESAINVKRLQICLKAFENKAFISSCSEYDINKKQDLHSFKIEQTRCLSKII
jgi:hypothetical protein